MGSFEGHSLPVRDLCFSSDGDRLITAAEDSRVKVTPWSFYKWCEIRCGGQKQRDK